MSNYEINPEFAVTDEAALRALFPTTHELAVQKVQTSLSDNAREFIRRAPFLCLGTQNADGKADVSPRGDPPGFVHVFDDHTLVIPDRPGNNRLDSLANIITNPSVGLLFIVPGFDDTLRVNGMATLVTDPDLLEIMSVNDRTPRLAVVVKITSVFMHCAKAFRRSRLWDPAHFQDRREMPSLIKIIMEETGGAPEGGELSKLEDRLEDSYKKSMY